MEPRMGDGEKWTVGKFRKKKICISISSFLMIFHFHWYLVVQLILMKWEPFFNFFIMADTDIPFLLTPRKPETQTLGGVGNLKFFRTIDINEMRAIFQYFHNGQHWYSISVDTQKTGDPNFGGVSDPNFGGVSNLKIFHMININKMRAIFQSFHNGWRWYSISVDTQKTRDPNFGGVSNLKFFRTININEMRAIFQFFHNGWHWYSFSVDT